MNITEALTALDTQFTNPDFQAEFDSKQLGKLHKQHSKLWQMHNWLAERDSSLVTDNTLEELYTLFDKYQTIYRDAASQVSGEVTLNR